MKLNPAHDLIKEHLEAAYSKTLFSEPPMITNDTSSKKGPSPRIKLMRQEDAENFSSRVGSKSRFYLREGYALRKRAEIWF
jgi:hypothetical protein